jgi:hypothetical protein
VTTKRAPLPLVLFLVCLTLQACGESSQSESKTKAKSNPDAELLTNIDRAGSELERRLVQSVSAHDDLIFVQDPVLKKVASYVLPSNSPWVMTCGFGGLSIAFGTSISGDGASVGNDVELNLTTALITQDGCSALAPRLGRRLKALLQGPGSSP